MVTTAVPREMIRATESRRTVLVALGANLVIAAAKLVGALLSGSKALLAEAGHSLADCLNEAFLLVALWRSRRPATSRHPFGFGKEQFFSRWDAAASMAVGSVLVGIAFELGRDSKSLLLGEGAYPEEVAALRAVFSSHDDVVDLVDMLIMRLGPRCGRSHVDPAAPPPLAPARGSPAAYGRMFRTL
jgi:divalent metal cation (Fe/Co/Zn/Cd) transporter